MTIRELLHARAMLFETPADGGAGPAAPAAPEIGAVPPAAPAAAAAAGVPPAATPPVPTSPWAQSLATRFTDPAQQAAVDAYLREEIQPYITRKEQELGEVGGIWQNLQDDEKSVPTYLAMAEQMYGPEVAEVFANALTEHINASAVDPGAGPADPPAVDDDEAMEAWLAQQPAAVQEYLREQFATREDTQYQTEIAQLPGGQEILDAGALPHFSRYVLAVDNGDVVAAKALWDQEMGPVFEAAKANPEMAQSLGFTFGAPAPAGEPPAPGGPPAVLGGSGATGATVPPTEPQYASMDEAMDDFFATVAPSRQT